MFKPIESQLQSRIVFEFKKKEIPNAYSIISVLKRQLGCYLIIHISI